MSHASWTASDGAPQGIQALAQAPDGTLWIGAIGGLYHFDGRTFTSVQSSVGQPEMPAEPVWSVLVTRDGTVWAGFYRSGVVRIARGRVSRFDMVAGRQVRTVQDLREARDGSVWAYGDGQVLMRFSRGDTAWH
jgi:ligand-binding sensor domain-containing protein